MSEDAPVAFVDASALVALADAGDPAHAGAVAAYRELVAGGYRLFTVDAVLAEAYDLLRAGLGPDAARRWLAAHRLSVYRADEADLERARQLLLDGPPLPHRSFADALGLATMERLGVVDAFAVDERFFQDGA